MNDIKRFRELLQREAELQETLRSWKIGPPGTWDAFCRVKEELKAVRQEMEMID